MKRTSKKIMVKEQSKSKVYSKLRVDSQLSVVIDFVAYSEIGSSKNLNFKFRFKNLIEKRLISTASLYIANRT